MYIYYIFKLDWDDSNKKKALKISAREKQNQHGKYMHFPCDKNSKFIIYIDI